MKSEIDELAGLDATFATHKRLAEQEERQRFRTFMCAGAAGTFTLALAVLLLKGWVPGLIGAGLGVLQLLVWHYGCRPQSNRRLRWLKQVVLSAYLAVIVVLSLFTGQAQSFVLWFLVLLPVMAAFVNTPPTAGLWAALATLAALGVWASDYWFNLPPTMSTTPTLRGITRIVLLLMVAVVSIRVRQTSDLRIRELAQSLAQENALKDAAEAHRCSAETARKEAEKADAAKTRVLAFMSHEIRTPLHGVLGLNSLLQETPLNAEQKKFLELSRNSGEVLLSLINDFLDISKLEADRLELESMVFDPCQLVEERVLILQETARQKGLVLSCDCRAPRGVRGDRTRTGQILLNLVSNAIKFTHEGGVILRCLAGPPATEAGNTLVWLRFEVEDTGIGIAAEMQSAMFLPFMQADSSTTRRYGGTGLGLAICKSLTEAMGGRLGVESMPGQGSLFWVELPFTPVPETQWPAQEAAAVPASGPLPAGAAGRVLLVEDNPVNQLMATEMLKRLGCVVETVGNGQEAVDAVQRLAFDLVLMDCDMPVMDGYEAARTIRRAEPAGQHLPIVAMTAAALPGDRERCFAAGMDDYLAKPVRVADLRRLLEHRARQAGAQPPATGAAPAEKGAQ
ncbi:MAG: BaeS [Moraxellaceae bacterium]|jgi:signal transduction histidine kinase/CheY-like chemotaxis protein|nr:BaeS [Moraxellaceae bacterium]